MNRKTFFLLHLLLLFYSLSDICSKLAAGRPVLSVGFILWYGAVILILFVYAIGWQQMIKRMPLSTAYANKAVTTIWGAVWGVLLFHEDFSVGKLLGILLVIAGIVLFTREEVQPDE